MSPTTCAVTQSGGRSAAPSQTRSESRPVPGRPELFQLHRSTPLGAPSDTERSGGGAGLGVVVQPLLEERAQAAHPQQLTRRAVGRVRLAVQLGALGLVVHQSG